jgi:hypothetical protein
LLIAGLAQRHQKDRHQSSAISFDGSMILLIHDLQTQERQKWHEKGQI